MQNQNKRFLQKVAGVCSTISFILAAICCAILLFNGDETQVFRASFGATTFFFAMVGIVLRAIASTNLPDLRLHDNPEQSHSKVK